MPTCSRHACCCRSPWSWRSGEYGLFKSLTRGREDLEFLFQFESFKHTTNAQLWWALFLSLPAYFWLRRFTRSSVFSLVLAVMLALLCGVTLLRMGMLEWLDKNPGRPYLRLIPAALLFFCIGILLERFRLAADSRYFYPIAVAFTYISLSGIAAFHKPYAEWLGRAAPFTRSNIDYLFIINAGVYFALQLLCERLRSAQMRAVGKAFRFVIPGHVLIPLFLLGLEATRLWNESPANLSLRHEARAFEVLLPAAACLFVLLSIPKQMKNYLASGMLFLAIGIIRLQQNWLKDHVAWPVTLVAAGLLLMLLAARYSAVRASIARFLRRRPQPGPPPRARSFRHGPCGFGPFEASRVQPRRSISVPHLRASTTAMVIFLRIGALCSEGSKTSVKAEEEGAMRIIRFVRRCNSAAGRVRLRAASIAESALG